MAGHPPPLNPYIMKDRGRGGGDVTTSNMPPPPKVKLPNMFHSEDGRPNAN